jgi:membrane protease YdiL (CAAX protease family)
VPPAADRPKDLAVIVMAAPPGAPPPLGQLIAGFAALAMGIAILTRRREHGALRSPAGTRRVLLYILAYSLTSLSFMRVLAPAILGHENSPWLMALGDVLCATLGLFVWVVALAERYDRRDFGLHGAPPARFGLALAMGLGSVVVASFWSWRRLWMSGAAPSDDTLIFSLTFSILGSAIPEELLFRGLLMSSLDGRLPRWGRVALPALIFTVVRSLRLLPGLDITPTQWWMWVFGTVLPLGLWWGLMRDLAGGSLWPGLLSNVLIEFCTLLAGAPSYGSLFTP